MPIYQHMCVHISVVIKIVLCILIMTCNICISPRIQLKQKIFFMDEGEWGGGSKKLRIDLSVKVQNFEVM